MKIRFLLLTLLTLSLPVISQDNVIDEVVWVVGDEPILRSDVENQKMEEQRQGVKYDGDPYCIIPEQLAIQKLFLHQADLDSMTVSDNEVMNMVDNMINNGISQLGSKEKLEEYFEKPLSKIRETFRDQARNGQLVKMVRSKLVENITVTPAEIRQFFSKLPTDSVPLVEAQYEIEVVTVEPQYPPSEIAEIKERLREFTERVNKGTSFSTLAIMYSDDKESAKVGGELGFLGKNLLLPEYANVAFSLTDPTKVSKIVETEYGFHIIQLIEKRGDRVNTRHILLKPQITSKERNDALARLDSISELIKTNKLTFNQAAQLYSFDKDTRNNGGLMVNRSTGTTQYSLENMPQEIGKIVYGLKVGAISKPFTMISEKGKELCAIVRLKSKINAHKANLTDDFQLFRMMVQNAKSEKVLSSWIKEKQRKTYVRINENWSNCEFKYPGWKLK
jgi:peptidyl-prolyl cis-trans isomerase SurA